VPAAFTVPPPSRPVEGQADLLRAVLSEPTLDFRRRFHRGAADNDAVYAIAQQVIDDRR
jgi:hypothetical protein